MIDRYFDAYPGVRYISRPVRTATTGYTCGRSATLESSTSQIASLAALRQAHCNESNMQETPYVKANPSDDERT